MSFQEDRPNVAKVICKLVLSEYLVKKSLVLYHPVLDETTSDDVDLTDVKVYAQDDLATALTRAWQASITWALRYTNGGEAVLSQVAKLVSNALSECVTNRRCV